MTNEYVTPSFTEDKLPENRWFTQAKKSVLSDVYPPSVKEAVLREFDDIMLHWRGITAEYELAVQTVASGLAQLKNEGQMDVDSLVVFLTSEIISSGLSPIVRFNVTLEREGE